MPRPDTSAPALSRLLMAAAAGAVLALTPDAAAAKPKPGDRGLFYCSRNNDSSVGDISYDFESKKCCFWEGDGNGGGIRVCLTCDKNWKNCKESMGARVPRLSTPPANLERAPNSGGSGFGTKPRGKPLNNQIRIEDGTE